MIVLLFLNPPSEISVHLVTVETIWMLSQVY